MKVLFSSAIAVGLLLAVGRPGRAQSLPFWSPDPLSAPPQVPLRSGLLDPRDPRDAPPPGPAGSRTPRLQLLGMPSGFLVNPLGVDPDDDPPPTGDAAAAGRSDPDFVQFTVGSVNPYFNLRLPGDPGGLGYYLVHSQLQLLDAGSTSLCLGLQAYTPSGIQSGGLANGPSYVVPALACFHDLGNGAALQGYFGQNIQANSHWTDRMNGSYHYGMAVQYPVPGTTPTADTGIFFYLEALGRYRPDAPVPATAGPIPTLTTGHAALWELVPGVHVRLNSNCWMSVGASRYNFLTCSWRY